MGNPYLHHPFICTDVDLDTIILLAILFIGGFLAAAISGSAGFGGALLLLPILVSTIGVELAIPVLTLAQLIGNLSRAGLGFKEIRWDLVGLFCIGAVLMTIMGALLFVSFPSGIITKLVGLAIIAFVLLRFFNVLKLKGKKTTMVCGGGVTGFISGLVGSAGPLGAAIFLSLDLAPMAYVASEAVTAVAMHLTKIVVYQSYMSLGLDSIILGLFIGVAMVLGTWLGRVIIKKIPKNKFSKFVGLLLIIVALQMVFVG